MMIAVIGSNKIHATIHQLGGQAGRNKKTTIPARPYLIIDESGIVLYIKKYLS